MAARAITRTTRSGHKQDGEFMAVRLSPKQAVGAVGAGAMSESGQVNHAYMRIIFRAEQKTFNAHIILITDFF